MNEPPPDSADPPPGRPGPLASSPVLQVMSPSTLDTGPHGPASPLQDPTVLSDPQHAPTDEPNTPAPLPSPPPQPLPAPQDLIEEVARDTIEDNPTLNPQSVMEVAQMLREQRLVWEVAQQLRHVNLLREQSLLPPQSTLPNSPPMPPTFEYGTSFEYPTDIYGLLHPRNPTDYKPYIQTIGRPYVTT